ncbi:RepB family plasmid replication initiator protein (plasmid) [Staphylococcus epidermidis]|uniref:replication initiation protein n=1 Tax=Staphylococcus epidermidis TaxID=1282 RepID=UPI001D792FD9|nr:RepB family plasmid replication initiator protein [Staphylococcus epidermidis]MBM6147180.1 RepB family plasmid replication initiator protein [Staphylococcus epidermidis]MBM6156116.1 RepB family plasmid replication initiator protein [Staphylococcus epidermidis]MBM6158358.1 RepB family plasmid replication initiator protein [Staphylococcus epidermidis]MCG1903166.1 RepB family plasmid replication initiator protein [Staphylococcus epidermidis]MCO6219717.1 RepB family plasmid replication initiato
MSGETVVYKNDMNLVPLRKFNNTEVNLFFTLCNKLKDKGNLTVNVPFEELKELSNYYSHDKKLFIQDLEKFYDKVFSLTYREETENVIRKFILFTKVEIYKDKEYVAIGVNPDLEHIINSLTSNFTKFELKEMTHLKSTYSKHMFRILKQYKHTGYVKIKIDDFRERLDIPSSYRMTNINQKVLAPIIKELGFIFNNLSINKIKAKKGRKIEWLEFTFDAEKRIHNKRQPQVTNIGKSHQYINREKTPKWLGEKIYKQSQELHNEDAKLKQDREAFQRQLEEKWEE